MSGTRKLEKFELDRIAEQKTAARTRSGTQKLEKFDGLSRATPIEPISPAMLAAARRSVIPASALALALPKETEEPLLSERARNRDQDAEKLRTRLARRFTTLADEVTEAFGEFRIGAGAWTVELTAPSGMSTKGGKEALQHLRLRPTRQGHVALIGGVVDPIAKTAELRDYEHMQQIYRARFDRALEITPGEWEQFLRKAEVVLRDEEIRTSRVAASRELELMARDDGSTRRQTLGIAALALATFAAAIVAWRIYLAL